MAQTYESVELKKKAAFYDNGKRWPKIDKYFDKSWSLASPSQSILEEGQKWNIVKKLP